MMWHMLLSALTAGCTLVLYDGSPLKDPAFLWSLVDRAKVTILGIRCVQCYRDYKRASILPLPYSVLHILNSSYVKICRPQYSFLFGFSDIVQTEPISFSENASQHPFDGATIHTYSSWFHTRKRQRIGYSDFHYRFVALLP